MLDSEDHGKIQQPTRFTCLLTLYLIRPKLAILDNALTGAAVGLSKLLVGVITSKQEKLVPLVTSVYAPSSLLRAQSFTYHVHTHMAIFYDSPLLSCSISLVLW